MGLILLFSLIFILIFYYIYIKNIENKNTENEVENNTNIIEFENQVDFKDENINYIKAPFLKEFKINHFLKQIKLYENNLCPYCGGNIEIKKTDIFKCPYCKSKIFKRKNLNNVLGLFTENEEKLRKNQQKELYRRKKIIKFYNSAKEFVKFDFNEMTNDNMFKILYILHIPEKYIKNKNKINQFRMCRFYESELQELFGYSKIALNCWLSVAYIDTWGFYHSGKWDLDKPAPYIIKKIKSYNYDLKTLEDLFNYAAKETNIIIKYNPPININTSWNIVKNYLLEN